MTIISFPVEVFDKDNITWRSESTTIWGDDSKKCWCFFTFKNEFHEMCDELGIPHVVEAIFNHNDLRARIHEHNEANRIHDAAATIEFRKILGLPPDYTGDVLSDVLSKKLPMPMSSVISLAETLYSKSIPNKYLLLCDSIEVPDHLVDKYLLLKLSMS